VVIKIDAEGAEWRVLKGFVEVLPCLRADVELVIELSTTLLYEEGVTLGDVSRLLGKHGFVPYLLANDYQASAYYSQESPTPPVRIDSWPDVDQLDVVFSRSVSASL
jgi:hypothetical protein